MPSKITTSLETPQVNVVSTPRSYDTSQTREFAITGINAGVEALADHFDRTNLRNADADIAAAAAADVAGQQQIAGKKEALLQQMMSGDESVVVKARRELDELRSATEQGVMSGPEREIRVNSLVKWYSNQYPHLGAQIRSMGSAANDNVAASVRAASGADPVEKARNALIEAALVEGKTPMQLIEERNLKTRYEMAEARGKALSYVEGATKEQMFIATNDQLTAYLTNRSVGVLQELSAATKTGKPIHTDQVLALLENARTQDKQHFNGIVNEFQKNSGVALTSDHRGAIDKQIDALYDSLKVQIGALSTSDNIAKWATAHADEILATGREKFTAGTTNLQAQLASKSPEAFNAYISAAIQTDMNRRRLIIANGGVSEGDKAFEDAFASDPSQMAMLRLAQRGELDDILAGAIGGVWNNGLPPETGTPYLDRQTKTITLDMYDRQSFADRNKVTANMVSSLDYNEILQSPLLMSDVRTNQQATTLFMEKATRQMMDWVGEPGSRNEMQINLASYNAPIVYKWGGGGSTFGINTAGDKLAKMNEMYRTIRDKLGNKAAQEWLGILGEVGVKNTGNVAFSEAIPVEPRSTPLRTAAGKKNTQAIEGEAGGDPEKGGAPLLNYYVTKAEQMQVPTHIVRAFARAESSDGKKLVGPETPRWGRAEGIGMIIRAKFDEVNGQYFNGRLQWDSQADKALASLTLIKSLYDKYGESGLDKIAGEYHGGPGWSAEKSDGLTQTGEYIERIRQLSQHFKEVSAEG